LQVQAPARQLQLVTPQVHCSVLLLDMMMMMVSAVKPMCETVRRTVERKDG
jgi:hypothetical protein